MIRNILVPLDRSKFGEHALPWALSLARRTEATVHLAHVQLPVTSEYGKLSSSIVEPYTEVVRKTNEGYLSRITNEVKEVSSAPLQAHLLEGDVCDQLSQLAENVSADLILMTTHGRGPFRRFWLGSVADRMVRQSPTPLMLVRPSLTPLDLKTNCEVKRVLVSLDGTSLSESILPHAVPLCRSWEADLTLLRVIEPERTLLEHQMVANLAPSAIPLKEELQRIEDLHKERAEGTLLSVMERLQGQELDIHTKVILDAAPASAILTFAEESNMDLIALVTHGRRGLTRMFMGSVADKVIRGTNKPVLIHRPGSM